VSQDVTHVINLVGKSGQRWTFFRTMIGHSSSYRVVFLVKVSHSAESFIAIDKIKFSSNCESGKELTSAFFESNSNILEVDTIYYHCNCSDPNLSLKCVIICAEENKVASSFTHSGKLHNYLNVFFYLCLFLFLALPIAVIFFIFLFLIIITQRRRLFYNFCQPVKQEQRFEMHNVISS